MARMTPGEMRKRIRELEAERDALQIQLEAAQQQPVIPPYCPLPHYPNMQPWYPQPWYPQPWYPQPSYPWITTCGDSMSVSTVIPNSYQLIN